MIHGMGAAECIVATEVGILHRLRRTYPSKTFSAAPGAGLELLRECVSIAKGKCVTEASGGVRLENVRAVAETGVDRISVGAITQIAPALNLALAFE